MRTHNICFRREIRKILCGYPILSVDMVLNVKQRRTCYMIVLYLARLFYHLVAPYKMRFARPQVLWKLVLTMLY